jgi:hypothetical protein
MAPASFGSPTGKRCSCPIAVATSALTACQRFAVEGKPPASVLVITVASVFFQCARAIKRSELWNPARQQDRATLPSPGAILQTLSRDGIDGAAYDAALQSRQEKSLY